MAEFADNSISATDKSKVRPGYDGLVAGYEAGEFDAIVCWDLDRLTRQPRQLEDWIDAAEDRGLLLVTANGDADLATEGGQLFARMKAAVARSEVKRKGERQRRAAVQRAELGRPPLGVRLTGYTPKGETIEHEAVIVKQVFERFAAGDSLRSLAAWLTSTGIPTRHGKPWNPSSVRTMLTNPRYAGLAVYMGKANGCKGIWSAIVDEDTFDDVQTRLNDPRRRTQQGTDRKHLGSGLFRCGVCSDPVRAFSGNRYRCPRGCLTRAQDGIDQFVLDVVRGRLARPDLADLLAPEESEEARTVGKEVKRLRARLRRISDDYDAELIDGHRYKVATSKVEAELAEAQRVQARLTTRKGAAGILLASDPVAAFDAAPLMMRRTAIDAMCVVVVSPAPRGRKGFDPNSVDVRWHRKENR
ncbi:DNA invertase Pin-like site-specific DNA recombinase [Lentzea nigeriaca]|nr:DNA invertase Pin-like site-specific DNA recombinase [Lentzea nigeriaca]